MLNKYCWFICKIHSFDEWINRNFFLKKIKEKNKLNCEANIVDSFAKYIHLTNGLIEIFFKKIKEKNELNCEENIVDSFAKYISFDKWVNRNF